MSGRHNGRSGERELQPWVNTEEISVLEALDESNSVRTIVEYTQLFRHFFCNLLSNLI